LKSIEEQVYPSQPHFYTCHGAALNKVYCWADFYAVHVIFKTFKGLHGFCQFVWG